MIWHAYSLFQLLGFLSVLTKPVVLHYARTYKRVARVGCSKPGLRVHVDNKPAMQLYESLGFKKKGRYKRVLWHNTKRPAS
jgi:RimJ/RimL family protein N-acetyltransferase